VANLNVLTQSFARGRQVGVEETMHEENVRTVLRMMTSEHLKAFDISNEPLAVRLAFGDSDFGRACLVARRLMETGVRVVEVTHPGWDTHQDNFHQVRNLSNQLDGPFAALISDLVSRDLLASTVVLCIGEFGRTPKINPKDGRDHWPSGFTDPTGARSEPDDPIQIAQLYATILTTLSIDPSHQVITPIGRPMKYCEGSLLGRLLES
jgi:hypothetical protein